MREPFWLLCAVLSLELSADDADSVVVVLVPVVLALIDQPVRFPLQKGQICYDWTWMKMVLLRQWPVRVLNESSEVNDAPL